MATIPLVHTPAPRDWETKAEYHARLEEHVTMRRLYPTAGKRHLAAERRWAEAKRECLVSVKTEHAEVLLLGDLD